MKNETTSAECVVHTKSVAARLHTMMRNGLSKKERRVKKSETDYKDMQT